MIDINKLRRLAQAATPHVGHACKYQDAHWLREGHVDFENADLFIASERPQEDAAFYAAANPAAISELLDRIEAAEKERDDAKAAAENIALKLDYLRSKFETAKNAQNDWLRANAPGGWIDNLRIENEALHAKITEMERQEPARLVTPTAYRWRYRGAVKWQYGELTEETVQVAKEHNHEIQSLYAIPGAHPAPSVPDGWKEGVEAAARLIDQKAERYANRFGIDDVGGLSFGQGPHAEIKMDHYTSMIELADEVRAMLAARARMSVPEGWKLVPIEPTPTMVKAGLESSHVLNVHRVLVCYDAMIDAAPEAKP